MAILNRPSSSSSSKVRKGRSGKGVRFLISVNVIGSAGPLRFVVNEDDLVDTVIRTALRSYAREGRLPVLGSVLDDFILYCAGSEVLSPGETIGSKGSRNFMLCRKQGTVYAAPLGAAPAGRSPIAASSPVIERKGSGGIWKSLINKSLNFMIPSH